MSIYGNRPFKEDTIYLNVHRISLDQELTLKGGKLFIKTKKNLVSNINNKFSNKDTDEYAQAFFDTLKNKIS